LALSILIWSAVFLFMNILFANLVISVGKEWVTVRISLIMALVNIVLNYLLIPNYSFVGASIATVITEILGVVMFFYYIYVNLIRNLFAMTIVKLVLLNTLLYFLMGIFDFLPVPILIVLSLLLYLYILLKTNCITREEVLYLKSFIG
jgi:O-antigen/teichoic acid export membrane protein